MISIKKWKKKNNFFFKTRPIHQNLNIPLRFLYTDIEGSLGYTTHTTAGLSDAGGLSKTYFKF